MGDAGGGVVLVVAEQQVVHRQLAMLGVAGQIAPVVVIAGSAGKHANATAIALRVGARVLQGMPSAFEQKALLRVHELGLAWRDTEEFVIEAVGIFDAAGHRYIVGIGLQVGRHAGGAELFRRQTAQPLAAGQQQLPEGFEVVCTGQACGHADDGQGRRVARLCAPHRQKGGLGGRLAAQAKALADRLAVMTHQTLSQAGDGGCGEEAGDGHALAEHRTDARDRLCGFQRGAAHFEEGVVAADLGKTEQRAPDAVQSGFECAHGRGISHGQLRPPGGRCGQGAAVDLAIGQLGQSCHQHKMLGQQMLGQTLGEIFAQGVGGGRCTACGKPGHQQGLAAGVVMQASRCLDDLWMLLQRALQLAQLDADAANLHLEVGAAKIFERAVGQQARLVTALVDAAELRMGNEAFGTQIDTAQIALRHLCAADPEHAFAACGHFGKLLVEQIEAGVGNGTANRHDALRLLMWAFPIADHAGLGGAVKIVQARGREHREEALGKRIGQGLASGKNLLEAAAAGGSGLFEKGGQHRGYKVAGGNAGRFDQCGEIGRIAVPLGLGQHHGGTHQPGPEDFVHRDIEAVRRFLQHAVSRGEAVFLLHPVQQIADIGMAQGHTLGGAGGARGIEQAEVIIGAASQRRVVAGCGRQLRIGKGEIDDRQRAVQHHGTRRFAHGLIAFELGQDERAGRVFEHEAQALGGERGVERKVGRARLEHRQQGHAEFQAARSADGHHSAALHALFQQ